MTSEVSPFLSRLAAERAGYRCEYCLLPQTAALHRHEVDHIVSKQHGGETVEGNVALACMRCNRYKGPNVGSFDPVTGDLVAFFNPRVHEWHQHFDLAEEVIRPLTPEARVTVTILRLNDGDRLAERRHLIRAGLFGP